MNFDSIGGRRYILVWGVFIAANVLLWFGKISPDVWQFVLVSIVGAYLTANVSQRYIEAKVGRNADPS